MSKNKLSSEVESQNEYETFDVIHSNPKPIIFIKNTEQLEALNSNELFPIISFLRNGNYTVKEITTAYPSFTLNPKTQAKSDKSIYRYLNELKEIGLVGVVGQRVTKGKTATEKVWGRNAKMFYIDIEQDESIESGNFCLEECRLCKDEGLHLSEFKGVALSTVIKKVTGQDINPKINISDWLVTVENTFREEIKAIISKLDQEEMKHFAKLPYSTIDRVLLMSAFMSLYKRDPRVLDSFYSKLLK